MKKVSIFRLRFWLVVARVGLVARGVLRLLDCLHGLLFTVACYALFVERNELALMVLRWGIWLVALTGVCALLHWMALWVCGRARKVLDAAGVENE